jgi:hypothetical protein
VVTSAPRQAGSSAFDSGLFLHPRIVTAIIATGVALILRIELEKSRLPRAHPLAYSGELHRVFCDCFCPRGGIFRHGIFKNLGVVEKMQTMSCKWFLSEQVLDRIASCSANCPGCHAEDPALGIASYTQEFLARAEPTLGSRPEAHCHWCGTTLAEVLLHNRVPQNSDTLPAVNDDRQIFAYCTACRSLAREKEMKDIRERAATCDASCTGCIYTTHRALMKTREEKQAELKRAWSDVALPPDAPHCFHCGLPSEARPLYSLKPNHPCCEFHKKVLRVCLSCQTIYVKDKKSGGRWGKRKKVFVQPEDVPPRTAECPLDCKGCAKDSAP